VNSREFAVADAERTANGREGFTREWTRMDTKGCKVSVHRFGPVVMEGEIRIRVNSREFAVADAERTANEVIKAGA